MAMKHWMPLPVAVALAACVTINVYFPAAEAKEAAKEFVEKVIGEDGQPVETGTFPATSPVATALGGKQLEPEKALNLAGGVVPRRLGNAHPSIVPYQSFATVDGDIVLAIGPEGGWIPYEVEKFTAAGLQPVQLGERILRVETAVSALLARLF